MQTDSGEWWKMTGEQLAHLRFVIKAVLIMHSALQRCKVQFSAAADEALQLLRLEELEHQILAPQLQPHPFIGHEGGTKSHLARGCETSGHRHAAAKDLADCF